MSFKTMSVEELRDVAERFAVDVASMPKTKIIQELEAEGVTFAAYEAFVNAEKVDPKDEGFAVANQAAPVGQLMLVKMDRENPEYSIKTPGGTYTFTKRHPFVAVPEDDADFIFETEVGFRPATPKEISKYYG